MRLTKKPIALTQKGHIHLVLPLLVFALIAAIGGYVYLRSSSAAPVTNAVYLESGIAGKCVDVWHDGRANGTKVDLYKCNKTAAQAWTFSTNGTVVDSNGACLDNWQQKAKLGNPIRVYHCSATDAAEQWRQVNNHELQNPQTKMCLDDRAFSTTNGIPLELWSCNGGKNQQWTPAPVSTPTTGGGSSTSGSGGTSSGGGSNNSGGGSTSGGGGTTSSSGFVTVSGSHLMLGGQAWRFIGFNPNGMIGNCWSGNNWTTAQMDSYFSSLPANGMSRIFAVQSNPGGAAYVESIVNEASKYHQHLIVGLSDANSNCSDFDGAGTNGVQGSGKKLSYYESAYKPGSNYSNWVNTLVKPLANNPTVAIWEISNEPFHSGNGEGGATVVGQGVPLSVAQAYINGSSALIKAAGAKQLISIAPADTYDMGGASDYKTLFSGLSLLDFHDYSWDWGGGTQISGDFAQVKQAAQALNKPFISDEVGVSGGPGCTSNTPNGGTADSSANHSGFSLAGRESWLMNKTNTELNTSGSNGGSSGLVYWNYLNANEQGYSCGFNMSPSDPMISAVKNYKLPQ
jgi:uncharacterized membrane protein YgcG